MLGAVPLPPVRPRDAPTTLEEFDTVIMSREWVQFNPSQQLSEIIGCIFTVGMAIGQSWRVPNAKKT